MTFLLAQTPEFLEIWEDVNNTWELHFLTRYDWDAIYIQNKKINGHFVN